VDTPLNAPAPQLARCRGLAHIKTNSTNVSRSRCPCLMTAASSSPRPAALNGCVCCMHAMRCQRALATSRILATRSSTAVVQRCSYLYRYLARSRYGCTGTRRLDLSTSIATAVGSYVPSLWSKISGYTGEYATAGISQLTSGPHPEYSSPQYASSRQQQPASQQHPASRQPGLILDESCCMYVQSLH
jgi:hypothetical protein